MITLFECPDVNEEIKKESEKLKQLDPIEEMDLFKEVNRRLTYLYKVKNMYDQEFVHKLRDVAIIKATIEDNYIECSTKGMLYFSDGNVLTSQNAFLDKSYTYKNTKRYVFDTPLVVFYLYQNLIDDTYSANMYIPTFGTELNTNFRMVKEENMSIKCFCSMESICCYKN